MNRQQKSLMVAALHKSFAESTASFIVEYQGLSVEKMQQLRKDLRKAGGVLQISKARLMKRAVGGIEAAEGLLDSLKGQIGLVFVTKESSAVAKVICDFSLLDKKLKPVCGYVEHHRLMAKDIQTLAKLPSREKLLALLCGTLQAPMGQFVRVLDLLITRLLWTLKQVADKKS